VSEPTWELLGGGSALGVVDDVGNWASGVAYAAGQVVRYNGVDYLAVNPSIGQTPPVVSSFATAYGTTLPAAPFDGQEAILVDSLTNPNYQWRFRYNAGSSSAYKWEFIGGPPKFTAGVSPTTGIVAPRAGDYMWEWMVNAHSTALYFQNTPGVTSGAIVGPPSTLFVSTASGGNGCLVGYALVTGCAAGATFAHSIAVHSSIDIAESRILPVRVA
jgi:hypothetical protein